MKKHTEIITVEHKGINVMIQIDYDNGMVSLVEKQNYNSSVFVKKSYIFANRGLEYMNEWLNIVEAITVAIKECKKELEHDLAEKSKFKEKEIVADIGAMSDLIRGKRTKHYGKNQNSR